MLKFATVSALSVTACLATSVDAAIYPTVTTRGVDDRAPVFDGVGEAATTNITSAGANRVGEVAFSGNNEGAMRRLIHVISLNASAKADLIATAGHPFGKIELPIRKQDINNSPFAQVEVFFVTENALDAVGNPINASTAATDAKLIALYQAPAVSILTTNFTVNKTIERVVFDITAAFSNYLTVMGGVLPDNLAMRYQFAGNILTPDGDTPPAADNWLILQGAGTLSLPMDDVGGPRNSLVTSIVPEPASLSLLALGGVLLVTRRR